MKTIRTKIIVVSVLLTALAIGPAFAASPLVVDMAKLDAAYIPALAISNQGKVDATKAAVKKLQAQWILFVKSESAAFPDDRAWTKGLSSIQKIIDEAAKAAELGNLPQVHETLEGVRTIFFALRNQRNIPYLLDGFTQYHTVMEEITSILAKKKAEDFSDADVLFAISWAPVLTMSWEAAASAKLDFEVYQFDAKKTAQIRSAMDAVTKGIDGLNRSIHDGTPASVYAALNGLKPAFTKAFLLFGTF